MTETVIIDRPEPIGTVIIDRPEQVRTICEMLDRIHALEAEIAAGLDQLVDDDSTVQ